MIEISNKELSEKLRQLEKVDKDLFSLLGKESNKVWSKCVKSKYAYEDLIHKIDTAIENPDYAKTVWMDDSNEMAERYNRIYGNRKRKN